MARSLKPTGEPNICYACLTTSSTAATLHLPFEIPDDVLRLVDRHG